MPMEGQRFSGHVEQTPPLAISGATRLRLAGPAAKGLLGQAYHARAAWMHTRCLRAGTDWYSRFIGPLFFPNGIGCPSRSRL